MITKKAIKHTDKIYIRYGSSTGYLFGLKPDQRNIVEAIVQSILEQVENEN